VEELTTFVQPVLEMQPVCLLHLSQLGWISAHFHPAYLKSQTKILHCFLQTDTILLQDVSIYQWALQSLDLLQSEIEIIMHINRKV